MPKSPVKVCMTQGVYQPSAPEIQRKGMEHCARSHSLQEAKEILTPDLVTSSPILYQLLTNPSNCLDTFLI